MTPKALARLQAIFAAGIVLWWAFFFAVARFDPANTATYLAFESAFPLPDLVWLVPLLYSAARANARGDASAPIWTAASGGALVFLGLLDASFNLQNDIYLKSLADGLLNGFINIACIGFGLWSIAWSKRKAITE